MSDEFDEIIDDVAREMTSASADADVARRVAARVANADARRRSIWTRPSLLAPLAAACGLAVAIFVARDRKPAVQAPAPVVVVAAQRPPARPVERRDVPSLVPARSREPRVATLRAVQDMNLAPIVVDRVDIAPIARAERIEIDPIAIARIEIPPMP